MEWSRVQCSFQRAIATVVMCLEARGYLAGCTMVVQMMDGFGDSAYKVQPIEVPPLATLDWESRYGGGILPTYSNIPDTPPHIHTSQFGRTNPYTRSSLDA